MDKLGKLLPGVLARQPQRGRLADLQVRAAFRKVVGDSLFQCCETIELRGSVLTVITSNPALAHQLRLESGTLIERIRQAVAGCRLREIRVRTGRSTRGPG